MGNKIPEIAELVAWLQGNFEQELVVVDHWDADRCAVGVALEGDPYQLVYFAAVDPRAGYVVELESAPPVGSDLPYKCVGRFDSVDRERLLQIVAEHLNLPRKKQDVETPQRFPCSCCGYLTMVRKPGGTFDLCPVCFWEDDPIQIEDHDCEGGANIVSLRQAQHFREFGASERQFVDKVRPPHRDEESA
jgi:hypothetical protein